MKRTYFVFLLLSAFIFLFSSCSNEKWHKTDEDYYFYGKVKVNCSYSWEGPVFGNLVHGDGILVKHKNGKVLSRKECKAKYGLIEDYIYKNTEYGKYLGEEDDAVPNGFGVLFTEDELKVGFFEEGNLCDGNVQIYSIFKDDSLKVEPLYIGFMENGEFNGVGSFFEKGKLSYTGLWKNNLKNGNGKEYKDGLLIYDGDFRKGKRDGKGREYGIKFSVRKNDSLNIVKDTIDTRCINNNDSIYRYITLDSLNNNQYKTLDSIEICEKKLIDHVDKDPFISNDTLFSVYLKYDGEWENGKYDGYGKLYNENILVYEGEWSNGLYDGEGVLYENGLCIKGKWEDGIKTEGFIASKIEHLKRVSTIYVGGEIEDRNINYTDLQLAEDEYEFFDLLDKEIKSKIESEVKQRVDERFGMLSIFRIAFQSIFTSDVRRMKNAESAFCENLSAKDLEREINAKIDYYNSNNIKKLSYIKMHEIPRNSIVTPEVAVKIFDRETMDAVEILGDIIITWLIVKILVLILAPFMTIQVAVIEIVVDVVMFVLGFLLSLFISAPETMELESEIVQLVIENYYNYLDMQNIVGQMLCI